MADRKPDEQTRARRGMLTTEEARRELGDAAVGKSDAEIAAVVESLSVLANAAIGLLARTLDTGTLPEELTQDERIAIEERAAVLEFDGKLPRQHALRRAMASHFSTRDRQ